MTPIIAPSILAADFGNLQRDIELINNSEAEWIHVDVMDGMFVPNISFGFPVMAAVKKHAKKPMDVHLMIVDPDRYLKAFKDAGADGIIVHYEACPHLHRTIQHIKELGCRAAVALNPHTPVALLEDIIGDVDAILCVGGTARGDEDVTAPSEDSADFAIGEIVDVAGGVEILDIGTNGRHQLLGRGEIIRRCRMRIL